MTESLTLEEWAKRLKVSSISPAELTAYGVSHGASAVCFYRRQGTWKVSMKGLQPEVKFERIHQRYEKD